MRGVNQATESSMTKKIKANNFIVTPHILSFLSYAAMIDSHKDGMQHRNLMSMTKENQLPQWNAPQLKNKILQISIMSPNYESIRLNMIAFHHYLAGKRKAVCGLALVSNVQRNECESKIARQWHQCKNTCFPWINTDDTSFRKEHKVTVVRVQLREKGITKQCL